MAISNETKLVHMLFNERVGKRIHELNQKMGRNADAGHVNNLQNMVYGLTEAQEVLAGIVKELTEKK